MVSRRNAETARLLDDADESSGKTEQRRTARSTTSYTTMSSKGQVVIPAAVRNTLHLGRHSRLRIKVQGKQIVLIPDPRPPDEDWRSLQGIYKGEGLTKRLEEEHAREREREDRKARR